MKFRIHGSVTNHDVAAHPVVLEVHGFNHVGAVEPTDTIHRLPICIVAELIGLLHAHVTHPFDVAFEMDEVTMVRLAPTMMNAGLVASYEVELVEDPAAPPVPVSVEEALDPSRW